VTAALRHRTLRLAHVAPRPPVAVIADHAQGDPSADVLLLVRPGAAMPAPAARPGYRLIAVPLSLHGLAVRYLERLLSQAAAGGWDIEPLAAFATELERRCWYLVCAPGGRPTGRRGRGLGRRPGAMLWRSGVWAEAPARDLVGDLTFQARARNDLLLAASSGSARGRTAARVTALLQAQSIPLRELPRGAAAELGRRWAIELLAAPRLTPAHLSGLRERFAGAPRCEWCALPVIGSRCRRCSPGAVR
jgi:hypothetical protein